MKTSIYISKKMIADERAKFAETYNNASDTFKKHFANGLTDDDCRSRIKDEINHCWYQVINVAEYTQYRNSITNETRKMRKRSR